MPGGETADKAKNCESRLSLNPSEKVLHRNQTEGKLINIGFDGENTFSRDSSKKHLLFEDEKSRLVRMGSKKELVKNPSHIKFSLQEHQELQFPDKNFKNDMVVLPSKKVNKVDLINGTQCHFEPPDVELPPESKYREAYFSLFVKD